MPVLADVVGGIDIQSQQFGDVDLGTVLNHTGKTTGESQVLVEHFEGVGQGQESTGGDGGHHIGNDHLEQGLASRGTVHFGGFQHILRQGLKAGNVNNHHVADLLPSHQNYQAPESICTVGCQIGAVVFQDAVENQTPDVAQHHTADQVGHEEYGAEPIGTPDLLGQGISNGEGHHVNQYDGDHCKSGSIPERIDEAGVLKHLCEIFQTYPLGIPGGIEIAE